MPRVLVKNCCRLNGFSTRVLNIMSILGQPDASEELAPANEAVRPSHDDVKDEVEDAMGGRRGVCV